MSTDTIERSQLTGTYTIDAAHSTLGFVARHAMVTKVRGAFNDFTGTFTVDVDDPGSATAEVLIQAASIDTRNADRDGHLTAPIRGPSARPGRSRGRGALRRERLPPRSPSRGVDRPLRPTGRLRPGPRASPAPLRRVLRLWRS